MHPRIIRKARKTLNEYISMREPIEIFTYDSTAKIFTAEISELGVFDHQRPLVIYNKTTGQDCRFRWTDTDYAGEEIAGWWFESEYKIFDGTVLIIND